MSVFAKQTSRYAKLKDVGESIQGVITAVDEPRQATKFNRDPSAPRQLDFWEGRDGGPPRPKMEVVITLQTELRDEADADGSPDDGQRKIAVPVFYKDGSQLSEIQKAIAHAGGKDIEVGATLGLRHTGHDPESQNMDNPRKLYEAYYKRPAGGGGAFAQGAGQQATPPAAAPQQAPAQQQAGLDFGAPPFTQQQAPAQQQAWQPPQAVNTSTGEFGISDDPWRTGAEPARPADMYQPPAAPTAQQQQAQQAFNGGGQTAPAAQAWQPPAAAPAPQQIDVAKIKDLIGQGAPDGYIIENTGASLEAVTAIRNIG